MSLNLELKYLKLLNAYIKSSNNKQIHHRCLICGDSKKNKYKARAYVLAGNDVPVYSCHNCGTNTNFLGMLNQVDLTLANAYKREKFKNKLKDFTTKKEDVFNLKSNMKLDTFKLKDKIELHDKYYTITKDLPKVAKDFIANRHLTLDDFNSLYYVNDLNAILIGFLNADKEVYGYQIRLLEKKQFYNVLPEYNPKIYGLDKVEQLTKGSKIYIFESIFDMISSGIENSIAMIGSSLSNEIIEKYLKGFELIFCLDNDETGITKSIKYTEKGYSILVHDKDFTLKDFNEAEMLGIKREQIKKYILANIESAKLANLHLRTRR